MKKLFAMLLVLALLACLFTGCKGEATQETDAPTDASTEAPNNETENNQPDETEAEKPVWKVAMITDYGDITDQSFNQTTYEAGKAWCDEHGVEFTYYKPTGDSTEARVASIDQAVANGYNVLLMPGFAFAETVKESADLNPDVKYIVLDVVEGDYVDYTLPENVYSAVYQEQIPGYMVGYAAVKLGYTKLAYLGGMAVPAVIRYGYGFVQGANAAAVELGIEKDVSIQYVYGNQFYGDADITAYMDTLYANGLEICFAAGGSIYDSACEAAARVGGKIIGVDVDQAAGIDSVYGEGMTVSSAMKGLAATVTTALTDLIVNDNWAAYGGKIASLGIISDDPNENYVQIAPSTQYEDGKFTEADYLDLVAKIHAGQIEISDAIDTEPEAAIEVNYLGNIK